MYQLHESKCVSSSRSAFLNLFLTAALFYHVFEPTTHKKKHDISKHGIWFGVFDNKYPNYIIKKLFNQLYSSLVIIKTASKKKKVFEIY